jgi:hypothetical protein
MSGLRKQRRDHEVQQPRRTPLDFAEARLRYTWEMGRHKRQYTLFAALLILAAVIGVAALLLANWLSSTTFPT